VVSFIGLARATTRDGRPVAVLVLESHRSLTLRSMDDIAAAAHARFAITASRVIHREGRIQRGRKLGQSHAEDATLGEGAPVAEREHEGERDDDAAGERRHAVVIRPPSANFRPSVGTFLMLSVAPAEERAIMSRPMSLDTQRSRIGPDVAQSLP